MNPYNLPAMKLHSAVRILVLSCLVLLSSTKSFAQLAPLRDRWGEQFNSPGAKLTCTELGRHLENGRTIVTYNLFATGLPKGEHFTLWIRNVGREPEPKYDAYLNEDGKVVNVLADPVHHVAEDPIDFHLIGTRGEPFGFALTSDDDRLSVFIQIVPLPIEANSGACHLSATLLGPLNSAMFIKVTGLKPNEELSVDTLSEDEGGQQEAKASERGQYIFTMFPSVKGKLSGNARVNIAAESCKIGIQFPWGEGSYRYQ